MKKIIPNSIDNSRVKYNRNINDDYSQGSVVRVRVPKPNNYTNFVRTNRLYRFKICTFKTNDFDKTSISTRETLIKIRVSNKHYR